MATSPNPHEEPGLSPMEFVRLQDELQKTNAELAAANEALRESEQRLEQRVAERTREFSTLLRVSHNIVTTIELEPLLGLILDQLHEVVEYRLASVTFLEDDDLVILAVRGEGMPPPRDAASAGRACQHAQDVAESRTCFCARSKRRHPAGGADEKESC